MPDDPTTRPFFEGWLVRELRLQRCSVCGHHQLYPRPYCLVCAAADLGWVVAAGTGAVYSKTRVHRTVREDLAPPYVVALVTLDEGPRLLSLLADEDLEIGSLVKVNWRERPGALSLPVFAAAEQTRPGSSPT